MHWLLLLKKYQHIFLLNKFRKLKMMLSYGQHPFLYLDRYKKKLKERGSEGLP